MERSVTERLIEVLKKKKADFILLTALPAALGFPKGLTVKQIEKNITPHLGEAFMLIKKGNSIYLANKQPDEALLLLILKKFEGKKPRPDKTPFGKDKYLNLLNRLLEQGLISVKLDKDYKAFLYPAQAIKKAPQLNDETSGKDVSEKRFKEAYLELERGKFYARICDLRRLLGWATKDFDAMLTGLRDAGKIQLQAGDIDYFKKEDIDASFIDENGTLKLTVMWRQ